MHTYIPQVFRQLRAEYYRLADAGIAGDALVTQMQQAYADFVAATVAPPPPPAQQQQQRTEGAWRCPTVRFGRTGLDMPVITCGGMRQQLTWRPEAGTTLADIPEENQKNFEAIVDRAMALGINHFETAVGYGTSQLQFGPCLKKYGRDSFILQTKIGPKADAAEFRAVLENSFTQLQVEYLDLFAFHGINKPEMLEWTLRPGGCMEIVEEYRRAGKIRWVGFSTHAHTDLIVKCCETGRFDYVNLHYHFVGSYTASGTWQGPLAEPRGGSMMAPSGNHAALLAAAKQDMGVFIISPNDKGGHLWKPSRVLVDACRPHGITPVALNALWLWSHQRSEAAVHTLVVGAARPSDFDEMVAAAKALPRAQELLPPIEAHLRKLMLDALGQEWVDSWWQGLPGAYDTPTGVFVPHIVWLHNLVKAWGMWDFARARYKGLEGNAKNWKADATEEANLASMNSYVPGMPAAPGVDVSPYLDASPHKARILEVLAEAHEWLSDAGEAVITPQLEECGWLSSYSLQPQWPWPEKAMH
ncbi:aldo/keto reductase [Tribonema minus]|uniref:Aldo/keto reductase n=1 Tax=Tribonema minus TaxID=303371 RepID=A0A835ZFP1_9STRA|nr:aldo/keto reductase [Tribonema minus]